MEIKAETEIEIEAETKMEIEAEAKMEIEAETEAEATIMKMIMKVIISICHVSYCKLMMNTSINPSDKGIPTGKELKFPY